MTKSPCTLLAFTFILVAVSSRVQGQGRTSPDDRPHVVLTGNARVDFFGQSGFATGPQVQPQLEGSLAPPHKSPWLAAGMSLVIPGAGDFYAESYWKAAAFFAADVAMWALAYAYDHKGDRQTDLFQNYANAHWSVVQYAKWTVGHATQINSSITNIDQYDVLIKDQNGNAVGVRWSELNRLERDIGNWYSHTLPPYGEQQYYELIGKYQEFYQGWDDADPTLLTYEQITQKLASQSTRFTYYSKERGKANDFYDTATTFVTIALINHVLAAADAAWSASSFNSVHARVGLQSVPGGYGFVHVPVLQMSYSF